MFYFNLYKYVLGLGFLRMMNVNECKIKINFMNNYNVKILDLIYKYNCGL